MTLRKLSIYLFPAMMDIILGAMFFITTVRLSESGASAVKVTATVAVWALVYSSTSILVGRLVSPKNAGIMLCASSIFSAAVSCCFVLAPGLNIQFLWIFLVGIGSAFFFTPFQVFMKDMEEDASRGVVRATSFYTFAWSFGLATGPFITGYIWGHLYPVNGWKYCYLLSALISIGIAISVYILKNTRNKPVSRKEAYTEHEIDYSKMPDLAWLGWLVAGIGCITVAIIRTLIPFKSSIVDISKEAQGNVLALVSYVQAFVGLGLCRSRLWMYKAFPVSVFSLSGITGLALFGFGTNAFTFYIGAILYGVYSGMFFFYLVFHSLVHPEHSAKYVSINEAVVGITSVFGPLLAGFLTEMTSSDIPFFTGASLVIIAVIIQDITYRRINTKSSIDIHHLDATPS